VSGGISITCTYPLETIRSRLSLQTNNSHYKGFLDACRTIPPRDLFQGLRMSILGFAPFSALSFSAYFTYKEYLESHTFVSVTYPTDLIRRRLQLQNFDKSVPKYSGILDCISKIIKLEGPRGLYRGLTASYIKLFPTIGIQFLAMERLNQCLK